MSGLYIERGRNFHFGRWLAVAVIVLLIIVAGALLLNWYITGIKPPLLPLPASALADTSVNEEMISRQEIDGYTVPATQPRFISIPVLGIEKARVQAVGLGKNRELEMPENIHDTGWYKESAMPGQEYGTVVIVGHGKGVTSEGVFVRISELKNGDQIIIERGDGRKIAYQVVENKTESLIQANQSGIKRLFTPYDETKEGLGLIAPAGNWIPKDSEFDKRVLVRAVVSEVSTK